MSDLQTLQHKGKPVRQHVGAVISMMTSQHVARSYASPRLQFALSWTSGFLPHAETQRANITLIGNREPACMCGWSLFTLWGWSTCIRSEHPIGCKNFSCYQKEKKKERKENQGKNLKARKLMISSFEMPNSP